MSDRPLLDRDIAVMKLSHCPNMLYAIAKQMIGIFSVYKCTINGVKTQIIADDYKDGK